MATVINTRGRNARWRCNLRMLIILRRARPVRARTERAHTRMRGRTRKRTNKGTNNPTRVRSAIANASQKFHSIPDDGLGRARGGTNGRTNGRTNKQADGQRDKQSNMASRRCRPRFPKLRSIPKGSIRFHSVPHGVIKFSAFPFCAIRLHSAPLGSSSLPSFSYGSYGAPVRFPYGSRALPLRLPDGYPTVHLRFSDGSSMVPLRFTLWFPDDSLMFHKCFKHFSQWFPYGSPYEFHTNSTRFLDGSHTNSIRIPHDSLMVPPRILEEFHMISQ